MKFKILSFACALLMLTFGCAHQQPQPAATWQPLFDGKTLAGWHHFGEGEFVVEDGCIVGKTQKAAKLYSHLVSDAVYRDFSVRLKFKSIKGNSGFYIRTIFEAPDKAHGLQIEVDPRKNSGGIYESYGRTWVSLPSKELQAKYFRPDDWNDLLIEAYGGHVKVSVNGIVSAELANEVSRPAGQLAMQMHAGNDMLVMFKDIEVLAEPRTGPDKKGTTSPQKIEPGKHGELVLPARHSTITGRSLAYMPEWDALGFWRAGESAEWEVNVPKAGDYQVAMEWSVNDQNAGHSFTLQAGQEKLAATAQSTGRFDTYQRATIGQIHLEAGPQAITLKAGDDFKNALMDLREVRLMTK